MYRPACLALILLLAGDLQTCYGQQPDATAPPCDHAEVGAFDFMVGRWHGEEKRVVEQDTVVVSTAEVTVRKAVEGCAYAEQWTVYEGTEKLFSAELLRAYDVATARWMLSYVDDAFFQVWEGKQSGERWQFHRTWQHEGQPVISRITWEPTAQGYQQRIEQSRDDGATWKERSVITYTPK